MVLLGSIIISAIGTQAGMGKQPILQPPTERTNLPSLEIGAITGSRGVSTVIKNNGSANAYNITWEIYITGGIFNLIYKSYGGLIPTIATGDEETITSGRCIGFGNIDISISASCDEVPVPVEKKVSGKIFLIWIKI
jgi:hypothetical protein